MSVERETQNSALPCFGPAAGAPPVILAPMAGITDLPFRRAVAGFGASMVVSEMVASQEVVQGRPLARARAELGLEADGNSGGVSGGNAAGSAVPVSVQIAGRDPVWMAEAARFLADQGARVIDINMGCPAKKVTSGWSGSALMREPDHALRLIEAVIGAVSVPVTLKMRLGWDDDSLNAPGLASRAASAGVAMITVHGRTRCQFYKGTADWGAIAATVAAVPVPVIANGDIVDVASARAALAASGAAGVMMGRGAQGRPWAPARIAAVLAGRVPPEAPRGAALADLAIRHHAEMLSFYGLHLGLRIARKHMAWYLEAAHADPAARAEVVRATSEAAVHAVMRAGLADAPGERAAA